MGSVSVTVLGRKDIYQTGLVTTLRDSGFEIALELLLHEQLPVVAPGYLSNLFIVIEPVDQFEAARKAVASLRYQAGSACIVVISQSDNCTWTMEDGIDAYLPRTISSRALLLAIELALCGEVPVGHLSSSISSAAQTNEHHDVLPTIQMPTRGDMSLSTREQEILGWLARGQSNKVIARSLAIEEATVKAHVRTVLRKTGAANRTQAAVRAQSWLLSPASSSIHGAN